MARDKLGLGVPIGLFVLLFGLSFLAVGPLRRIETLPLDAYFRLRPVRLADPAVFIVAVDAKSVSEMGETPWRPEVFVRLLEEVSAASPRAIVICPSAAGVAAQGLGEQITPELSE